MKKLKLLDLYENIGDLEFHGLERLLPKWIKIMMLEKKDINFEEIENNVYSSYLPCILENVESGKSEYKTEKLNMKNEKKVSVVLNKIEIANQKNDIYVLSKKITGNRYLMGHILTLNNIKICDGSMIFKSMIPITVMKYVKARTEGKEAEKTIVNNKVCVFVNNVNEDNIWVIYTLLSLNKHVNIYTSNAEYVNILNQINTEIGSSAKCIHEKDIKKYNIIVNLDIWDEEKLKNKKFMKNSQVFDNTNTFNKLGRNNINKDTLKTDISDEIFKGLLQIIKKKNLLDKYDKLSLLEAQMIKENDVKNISNMHKVLSQYIR